MNDQPDLEWPFDICTDCDDPAACRAKPEPLCVGNCIDCGDYGQIDGDNRCEDCQDKDGEQVGEDTDDNY